VAHDCQDVYAGILDVYKRQTPCYSGFSTGYTQARSSDSYLSGLWRESLRLDLLWQIMPGGTNRGLTFPHTEQNAPSWSSASVNRTVTWNPLPSPRLLAEMVSADTTLAGANPFSAVTGSRIARRGRVKSCSVQMLYTKNKQWTRYTKANGRFSEEQCFRADGQLMAQAMPDGISVARRACAEEEGSHDVATSTLVMRIVKTP
jgi:hypothetical protein